MARDAILTRRDAEFRRTGRVQELVTKHVVGAVYAAAGNRRGAKSADRIDFFRDRTVGMASTERLIGMLGMPELGDLDAELRALAEAAHAR